MKAYELKARLSPLDDGAEVSIEVEHPRHEIISRQFSVETPCGCHPLRASIYIRSSDLQVVPEIDAKERIEELEQQLDDLKDKARRLLAASNNYDSVEDKTHDAAGIEELTEATDKLEALL